MAAQPTDTDIELMCSLTNISRSEALSRLKGNNNNVSQAINEFYEDPGRNPDAWDETHFNTDRDGSTNKAGISFQVQSPDDHGTTDYFSSAPSRPPSRTSNRSPLGKSVSQADGQQEENRIMTNELQDSDLQKALAESAQEAGLPPQEYGVTITNGVRFGPATRSTYDQSKWQLIHLRNGPTQEDPPLPTAEDRKREDGAPAFLRPGTDDNRLASILTIYHEIPLAREIFLRRADLLPDFGHDPEWWTGKAITRTRNVRRSSGEDLLLHELQRLMAFLDKTDRSYGSAEALANLNFVKDIPAGNIEGKFFEAWKCAQRDEPALGTIFSEAIQPIGSDLDEEVEANARNFAILDLRLPNADDPKEYETIYDLTDRILWMRSGLEVGTSAYLTHVAEIVGFRLVRTEASRSISIPEIWFPDRYLEAGREAALEMRKQKAEIRASMMKLYNLEQLLRYFTLPGGKTVKVQDLFDTSLMHDAQPTIEDAVNGVDADSIDTEMNVEPRVGDKIDVSAELHKVMASINRKLQALDEEKQRALASLHELSKLFTKDHKDPNQPQLHKYKLCGVSTTKEITYIRRQAEPDLIEMDLDGTESNICGDQWWKIKYSTDAKPASVTKVKLEDVLTAAMTESKTFIVIYASERAMAEPIRPLPPSLEAFVRADNLAFSGEFPHNAELQDSQSAMASPVSPGKRKYDESSDESMEAPPRYMEQQPRWGGRSPNHDNGIIISHQEVDGFDDGGSNDQGWPSSVYESGGESITPPGNESDDIIMGQDPNELAGLTFPSLVKSETHVTSLEIQGKGGMSTLVSGAMGDTADKPSATDCMDVDEMLVDEARATTKLALTWNRNNVQE